MYRLVAAVLKYGEPTSRPVNGAVLKERIEAGAFDQQILGEPCAVYMNHDCPIPGASASLLNRRIGLFAVIRLPASQLANSIMSSRSQWRGVSLSYFPQAEHIDWNTCMRVVKSVRRVKEVSLVTMEHEPKFSGTWFDDFDAGFVRMKAEEEAWRVRTFGSSYRQFPRELWDTPLQAGHIEEALRARDPDRRWLELTS